MPPKPAAQPTRVWAFIRVHLGLLLLVWCVVLGTTATVSALLPSQYVATASLVLDVKTDPIMGNFPAAAVNSLVTTQVDVMASERVARRVIRNLKLHEHEALRQQWQQDTEGKLPFETWLVESMRKRVDIRPSRDSNVILVGYRATDARSAAAMANGFVQAYLDTALELRVDPARQFATFFDERARQARAALSSAQDRLAEFQQRQGLMATDERLDIESSRLAELSSQLAAAMGQRSDAVSRLAVSQGRSLTDLPDVQGNPQVAGLMGEHSRMAARLQELDARLGPEHPQRQEAAAGVAELARRLEEAVTRAGAGLASHEDIAGRRVQRLQADLALQRQRVMEMKAARNEAAVLGREVENAQRAFDAVVGRQQLTELESQTTQAQAYWLSPAAPPAEADSPKFLLNMVLAAFFGAVLSVLVALWWSQSRKPAPHSLKGPGA